MAVVIQSTRTVFPQIIGGHYVVPVGHRYFVERPEGRDDWLMLVSLRGVGRIHSGGNAFRMVPDLVALFPPGVTQGYRAWPGEPWNFLWIHFFPPEDWHRRALLDLPLAPGHAFRLLDLRPAATPTRRRIRQALLECVSQAAQDTAFGDALAMNLLERALLLCAHEAAEAGNGREDAFAREIRALLARQCDRPLTVASLAAHFHVSPSRFAHRFRAVFGMPPMAYVELCRLERAKRLILAGLCDTVKAAALDAGFRDPCYFARRFRRRYGIPPGELIASTSSSARN